MLSLVRILGSYESILEKGAKADALISAYRLVGFCIYINDVGFIYSNTSVAKCAQIWSHRFSRSLLCKFAYPTDLVIHLLPENFNSYKVNLIIDYIMHNN